MTSPLLPHPPPPQNYSLHAIPTAYLLAFPPHLYFFIKCITTANSPATNLVPRTNLATLKPILDPSTWQKLARARGAHLNALEGFPLFASAMLAANYAKLDTREVNWLAAEYLVLRVVYMGLYMGTGRSERLSYARSGVYALGVGVPLWVLWKAGVKMNEERGEGEGL